MSKHDYSKYSSKPKQGNNQNHNNQNRPKPVVEKPVIKSEPAAIPEAKPVVNLIEETVNTVILPETVEGTVKGCAKLNVRSLPSTNGEVVAVLGVDSEIEIDIEKSTVEWFRVITATGIEGYCMRQFIEAYL